MSDPNVVIVPNPSATFVSGAPPPPPPPPPNGWGVAPGSVTIVMQSTTAAPDQLGSSARYSFNMAVWAAVLNGVALVLSLVCLFAPWVVVNFTAISPFTSSVSVGLFGQTICSRGGQCQTVTWAAVATTPGSLSGGLSAAIIAIFGVPTALIAIAALMFLLALIGNSMHAVTAKKLIVDGSINTKMCCLGSAFSGTGLSATGFVFAWIGCALGVFWFSLWTTASTISSLGAQSVTTPGITAAGCVFVAPP